MKVNNNHLKQKTTQEIINRIADQKIRIIFIDQMVEVYPKGFLISYSEKKNIHENVRV